LTIFKKIKQKNIIEKKKSMESKESKKAKKMSKRYGLKNYFSNCYANSSFQVIYCIDGFAEKYIRLTTKGTHLKAAYNIRSIFKQMIV